MFVYLKSQSAIRPNLKSNTADQISKFQADQFDWKWECVIVECTWDHMRDSESSLVDQIEVMR